jgi:penicillin amidase
MVWGKVMSWELGMNLSAETSRARLLKYLSPARIEDLYPPYPSMNPFIVPGHRASAATPAQSHLLSGLPLSDLLENIPARIGPEAGLGSNNWVIAGNRTASGKPLLANDPHLEAQMPNIWYQVHLQCFPENEDCRFNVAGFSFPGVPGVIIGHNQRIAWGFTNIGPDVMDLFVEKVNPENPDQYEVNGTWTDMEIVQEQIRFPDGNSEPVRIRYTQHGPVVSDFSKSAKDISRTATTTMPQKYAIALRWTALDPSTTFPAIWQMNLARNWQEFRTAASHFDVPSQNIVYADVEGNIGYQFTGLVPLRKKGDGRFPVPGWTDDYEWHGFIPFEELPREFNPASGYIATANNAVVSPDSNNFITTDWDYGWRAKRIVDLIESKQNGIDLEFVKKMQGDNKNYNAEHLVPMIMKLELNDPHLVQIRSLLRNWDYQQSSDSGPAALFEVFWKNLLEEIFYDDLPANHRPAGGSRWIEVVRRLLQQPENRWWDNQKTTAIERRDDVLKEAFRKAVLELETRQGKNPAGWQWGDLHTVTFRNGSFGQSGIRVMEWFFNRGPFPTGGGSAIVNATSWNATDPYEVTGLPSMRMIVDLADLSKSVAIHTTGQSGHAFHPHYIDMAEPWRKLEYQPMLWERSGIQANAEGTLRLVP